jgi:UDP-glucose 4-epimerase
MGILVTGGAGFIGEHLAEWFVVDGHDDIVLDTFDSFYDTQIKKHTVKVCRNGVDESNGSYPLVKGDVRDATFVTELVEEADYIYYQATQAGVRPSIEKYDEINFDGTLNILNAALNSGIERVVFALSSSVYGKPEYLSYDESHLTTPMSPYGALKLAAERYASAYSAVYGLSAVALRYFTGYGLQMLPNMAISNVLSRCLDDELPVIYDDGTQTRDFRFIEDAVEMNVKLLPEDTADSEVLNVGNMININILTMVEEIREQLALQLETEFVERHDAEHTHANRSKASDLLGYEPIRTIRESVAEFVEWYRTNQEWREPLIREI